MRFVVFAASCLMLLAGLQPAQAAWAVAQSDNGQPFSQRFRLQDEAHANAMDACKQRYQNCRVIISGNSGCVAIATTGSQWGVAKGGSQPRADAAALAICEGLNAGACTIEQQFCGR